MDVVLALETLEAFRRTWSKCPKGEVFDATDCSGNIVTWVLFELSHYQVALSVIVGPGFGIHERCQIVDTRPQSSDVEHLVVSLTQSHGKLGGILLEPSTEVLEAKRAKDRTLLTSLIRTWITSELDRLTRSPERFESVVNVIKLSTEGRMSMLGCSIIPAPGNFKRT